MKKITNVRRFGSGKEYHMSETVAAPVREVDGRTVPAGGTWVIDPDHSSFEFVARHLMARIRGRFDTVNGTAQIAEVPENSSVQVEIEAGSVDTHAPQRDGHVRSADFFDVEKYPKITYRSAAVRRGSGESSWVLDGELTIRDVTLPVTFQLEFNGASADPSLGQRAGFSAWTEVNREDWGLTWNAPLDAGGFVLSSNVRLEIEVELVRQ